MDHLDAFQDEKCQSPDELLENLLNRASRLLSDLTTFEETLSHHPKGNEVEIRKFRATIETERRALERSKTKLLAQETPNNYPGAENADAEDELKRAHALRSSNLPFYEAVWHTARQCRGIRTLGKRVYFSPDIPGGSTEKRSSGDHRIQTQAAEKRRKHILVDIVADDGLEWIKVSTVAEKRLLFELAKEGWEGYYADSESDDDDNQTNCNLPAANGTNAPTLELVRLAQDLQTAAKETRVRFRHPRIRFVLPKITEGRLQDIDAIIADIRATGARVECGVPERLLDHPTSSVHMLHSPTTPLTTRLNIDCTILLALISDISHLPRTSLPPCPNPHSNGTYHSAIRHQIDVEEQSPFLLNDLYPILEDRDLECTHVAANRMREIVDVMGTPDEKERAFILLGEGKYKGKSEDGLRCAMSQCSSHHVPANVRFPIKVVHFTPDMALSCDRGDEARHDMSPMSAGSMETFKAVAEQLLDVFPGGLSEINASVFFHGWSQDIVTVTSNRAVAAGIEKCLDGVLNAMEAVAAQEEEGAARQAHVRKERGSVEGATGEPLRRPRTMSDLENFDGPKLWVCETARSLIGKDKNRREG